MIEGVFRLDTGGSGPGGYLSPEVVFVDGTHIKANANLKKRVKKEIPVAAKRYQEQLTRRSKRIERRMGKSP